ncbi:DUF2380 domain-containing protein [Archangium sp.]|uniref:DUF2380 domain-containing protein n=1 Tax=Archangium sp. TaxID=1872627 RepID=UPI00286D2929|nr:DUF2380 domain-containing protein [Archangium sp.]
MRADSSRVWWTCLLLVLALLSNACAPLMPPPGRGMRLHYTPHGVVGPAFAEGPSTAPGPGGAEGTAWRSALAAHLAFRGAVGDVSGSTRRISGELSRLRASHRGIAGKAVGIFVRYVEYGERQLRWIDAELAAATRLATTASEVDDPDMQLALLRLAGPRLEAAMMGSLLLAVWTDFLLLTDAMLSQHLGGVETLYVKMERWQKMMEPSMNALSSLEPGQVEAAARDVPALVGHLTDEFAALGEAARKGAEVLQNVLVLKETIEALTLMSALRFSLPAVRPAAPAMFGMGLMAGPNGVMMGTRVVVSAEWVEMMRQLVRAGVISLPAVSAAVRIQAGQVMMAESNQDLPQGVRDALGDGPEVRGMRVTGRAGAGMAEPPEHHVLPREFREWFEQRGFTGEMSIDQFCVRLEQSSHQALHGGGNWRLGRMWPGEWNQMIMKALRDAETVAGRPLTPSVILKIVAREMKRHNLPVSFVPWRGR